MKKEFSKKCQTKYCRSKSNRGPEDKHDVSVQCGFRAEHRGDCSLIRFASISIPPPISAAALASATAQYCSDPRVGWPRVAKPDFTFSRVTDSYPKHYKRVQCEFAGVSSPRSNPCWWVLPHDACSGSFWFSRWICFGDNFLPHA